MKEKSVIWKRLGILLGITLLVFLCINAVWYITMKIPYDSYLDKVERVVDEADESVIFNYKVVDGYKYSVKEPGYLGYGGFLSVGKEEGHIVELDKDGNITGSNGMYLSLYVWPKAFKETEYGMFFMDEGQDVFQQVEIDSEANLILTKEIKGNVELIEYLEGLVEEYKEEILGLIGMAQDFWNID